MAGKTVKKFWETKLGEKMAKTYAKGATSKKDMALQFEVSLKTVVDTLRYFGVSANSRGRRPVK